MIGRLALCAALIGAGALVGVAEDVRTAPAAHAACYGSVSTFKGKNNTCAKARHWNVIRGGGTKYAPWASKSRWSTQPVCWANIASHGMTAG